MRPDFETEMSPVNQRITGNVKGLGAVDDRLGSSLSVDYWQIVTKSKPFQLNSVPEDFEEGGSARITKLTPEEIRLELRLLTALSHDHHHHHHHQEIEFK